MCGGGGVWCNPKADIVKELVSDVEPQMIQECRDNLFGVACDCYNKQLRDNVLGDAQAKLELKQRRGDTSQSRSDEDIVELILYICKIKPYFPRDVISSKSVTIDIESQSADSNASKRKSRINTENNSEVTVDELDKKCGQYERSIKRLWQYILNIEKLHGEEIEQMKVKFNCQCGGTGLKQSTSVYDNASQRAVPPGVTGSHSRPAGQLGQAQQPGICEPAPAPQDQLAPRDLIRSASAQTPTISEMLSDDSNVPGNNSDNINNIGNRPEVNSSINYSSRNNQYDNIPCAQPQRDAASNTSNLDCT